MKLDESFAGPDIMFGYYHASLVVEFLIGRFGVETMRSLLADLSAGKPLEQAWQNAHLPLAELETAFQEHAKNTASAYGPDLDWTPLTDEEYIAYRDDPAAWVSAHPKRYAAAMMWISKLTEDKDWKQAKALLEKVIAAEPDNREQFNPYQALSLVCRGLGDEAGERAALTKLLQIDSNASEAAARLLELSKSLPAAERLATADTHARNQSISRAGLPHAGRRREGNRRCRTAPAMPSNPCSPSNPATPAACTTNSPPCCANPTPTPPDGKS